ALERARAAAAGKNVIVMGGADLLRQYLAAGLVDEFTLTIAPVLLGAGKRLFDGISSTELTFERTSVVESPFATHLRYRVRPPAHPTTRNRRFGRGCRLHRGCSRSPGTWTRRRSTTVSRNSTSPSTAAASTSATSACSASPPLRSPRSQHRTSLPTTSSSAGS